MDRISASLSSLMSNASWFKKQQIYLNFQARVVAFVHVKLKRRKIANAQPKFFESFSKLLQTFVALESQIKERILERIEVKIERTKEDHAGHHSGGVGRATSTSLG